MQSVATELEQRGVKTISFGDAHEYIAQNGTGETPQTSYDHAINEALSKIVTAQSIIDTDYPEPKFAVKGVILEGTTILAGPPKLGKSLLVLNIAVAVAEGGKALSALDVDQGAVLYLALEDSRRRIQERLLKITNGKGVSDNLRVATEWLRLDNGGLEAIDRWITSQPNPRLVIVDTLKMLRPIVRSDNVYNNDYEAIQPLTKIAAQRVALVIVHHTRKALADDPLAMVSGSYGLTGAADGVLVLRRARGKCEANLDVIGRDVEEQELALEFKPKLCLWACLGKADVIRRSNERKDVIEILSRSKELMTPKEIAEQLDKGYGAVKKLLFSMKMAGEVKSFAGKYQLPDFNPEAKSGNPGNPVTETAPVTTPVTASVTDGNPIGNPKRKGKANRNSDLQVPVTGLPRLPMIADESESGLPKAEDAPVTVVTGDGETEPPNPVITDLNDSTHRRRVTV